MYFDDFYALCRKYFSANSDAIPALTEEKAIKLFALTEQLIEKNSVMNLTAIKDVDGIIAKHYCDSLTICKYIPKNARIIDVGCGAGFPSLPLAIFRPDISITSLDGTEKRINYVNSTAKLLKLNNLIAIADRAEIIGCSNEFRERFDVATARAVAGLPILSELCIPFVKIGGSFIAMKSQRADEEISQSLNAISKCGGKIKETNTVTLHSCDDTSETRTIVLIEKTSATPKEFPRHYSKICKKPL